VISFLSFLSNILIFVQSQGKVERLVIDGIVDMKDYFRTGKSIHIRGLGVNTSFLPERRLTGLLDTNKTLNIFFESCHAAGPKGCAFYDDSPDQIRNNLDSLYTAIRKRPVPVAILDTDSGEDFYGIIDYDLLHWTVFMSLYSPYKSFVPLAEALADVSASVQRSQNGSDTSGGEKLYRLFKGPNLKCEDACDCTPGGNRARGRRRPNENRAMKDAEIVISCNDGDKVSLKYEDLKAFYEKAQGVSEWAGIWATIRADCS
jgi:hypothetical protein